MKTYCSTSPCCPHTDCEKHYSKLIYENDLNLKDTIAVQELGGRCKRYISTLVEEVLESNEKH